MKAAQLSVGDVVRLTPDGARRYGMSVHDLSTVSEIRPRPGYRVPWVIVGNGWAFKPSDLRRVAS